MKKNTELKAYYNKPRDNWFVPFKIKDPKTHEIKTKKKYYSSLEEAMLSILFVVIVRCVSS